MSFDELWNYMQWKHDQLVAYYDSNSQLIQMQEVPKMKNDFGVVTLNAEDEDVWCLFISSFRYALGRRTYMPSTIAGIVLANKSLLTGWQRRQLAKEVYEHEETYGSDSLGDKCDKEMWYRFAEEIVEG